MFPDVILTLTCLLSLSANGYEEHSMDATDSQHYKEVQQGFFCSRFVGAEVSVSLRPAESIPDYAR